MQAALGCSKMSTGILSPYVDGPPRANASQQRPHEHGQQGISARLLTALQGQMQAIIGCEVQAALGCENASRSGLRTASHQRPQDHGHQGISARPLTALHGQAQAAAGFARNSSTRQLGPSIDRPTWASARRYALHELDQRGHGSPCFDRGDREVQDITDCTNVVRQSMPVHALEALERASACRYGLHNVDHTGRLSPHVDRRPYSAYTRLLGHRRHAFGEIVGIPIALSSVWEPVGEHEVLHVAPTPPDELVGAHRLARRRAVGVSMVLVEGMLRIQSSRAFAAVVTVLVFLLLVIRSVLWSVEAIVAP